MKFWLLGVGGGVVCSQKREIKPKKTNGTTRPVVFVLTATPKI